ncbi:MAG: hypothetical protein M1822_004726 [Bathelium mastoideum]|nr:MAG: hypothetical protein M1822_004726 [Bathelium mastoideum]
MDPLYHPESMTMPQAERVLNLGFGLNTTNVDKYRAFYRALFPKDSNWETINPYYDYYVPQYALHGDQAQDPSRGESQAVAAQQNKTVLQLSSTKLQPTDKSIYQSSSSSAVPRTSAAPMLSPTHDNTVNPALFSWAHGQKSPPAEWDESYDLDDKDRSPEFFNGILDDLI